MANSDGTSSDPPLSASQEALLREFSQKAGRNGINRSFSLTGVQSKLRLERQGLMLKTTISDDDLLALARSGYVDYRSQDGSVAFLDKACDHQSQAPGTRIRHSGPHRPRLRSRHIEFGTFNALTIVRAIMVAAALILLVLYLAGRLSTATVGTLATVGGLLVSALALQITQRGKR
jgi:hypothetical protein